ncbi:sulfotransferase 1B1-like [Ptychodera flava]|uniref:sulfotransferase 1B1-like n=1 Tax=Ptychodera flava TaxID=63121 RepID=UPI00396AAD87
MENVSPADKAMGSILPNFPKEEVKQMAVRHDDLFLLTYPKSGTHWLSEVIPLILNGGDTKSVIPMEKRAMTVEVLLAKQGDDPKVLYLKTNHGVAADFDPDDMESPRFLSSHFKYEDLPTQLLEKKPKVIYLARNPKDVAVSMLNQITRPPFDVDMSFDVFLELLLTGKVAPGQWGPHVLDWWEKKDEDHVLFLKYEDLKKDLKSGVKKIAVFIEKDLTAETIAKIADHCTIDNMKKAAKDDPVMKALGWKDNPFIRKGIVGGWKEKYTVAQSELVDKYYKEWLEGTGLEFEFE